MTDAIAQYLERYAEPEARFNLPAKTYQHSLVIPAYQEVGEQLRKVWERIDSPSTFLVIIINNRPAIGDNSFNGSSNDISNDSPGLRDDAASIMDQFFIEGKTTVSLGDGLLLIKDRPDILIIDRHSEDRTINPRQGVGLARKIGMDVALQLHLSGVVSSNWLFTTDADAVLPQDYFVVSHSPKDAALIYPCRHLSKPGYELATSLYEINLLYYTAGLSYAGSPYAYPTIGSTISCAAKNYAAVRGVPKRNTGEDFYLLNKLRKTGEVTIQDRMPILLSGRLSERVPIGTGRALIAISALQDPHRDYRYEHFKCFEKLAEFQRLLQALSKNQPDEIVFDDPALQAYCEQNGFCHQYLSKVIESPSPKVLRKHLQDWFDGLKTRQFIHHFRDHHFGTISAHGIIDAPFIPKRNEPDVYETSLAAIVDELQRLIYHPHRY
jgi:hypothetical protein